MIENRHNNTENQTTTTLYCFRKIEKLKQIDIFCIYNHMLFGMINKLQHEVREVWKYILTEKKQVSLRRCFQKIYDFSWGNTSSYYPHRHAVNVLYNLHVSYIYRSGLSSRMGGIYRQMLHVLTHGGTLANSLGIIKWSYYNVNFPHCKCTKYRKII